MHDLFEPGDLTALLVRPHTRYTTFVGTLVEFVGLAKMAFLPALLPQHQGLSARPSNLLFAVFFATTAPSRSPAGSRTASAATRRSPFRRPLAFSGTERWPPARGSWSFPRSCSPASR